MQTLGLAYKLARRLAGASGANHQRHQAGVIEASGDTRPFRGIPPGRLDRRSLRLQEGELAPANAVAYAHLTGRVRDRYQVRLAPD
jgi:hypothetical protein